MTTSEKDLLEVSIVRASEADLDDILALQVANQREHGGTLSANFPRSKILAMMQDMPLIVARRGNRITGFLVTSSRAMNVDVPIIRAMLEAYPGSVNAYVYGPICISVEERGKGLAQEMFSTLRSFEPAREGILFIRRDNKASLRAHAKMGMSEVAEFEFKGERLAIFSYVG